MFCVKDTVDKDEIEIACCTTKLILGDFFTKPFQGTLFKKFIAEILGHQSISILYEYNDTVSNERVEVRKITIKIQRESES